MTKTLKLFSLLFMFAFAAVFADSNLEKYRLYVTEVDTEFHCFRLSNSMVFHIPEKNWETAILPEEGTEIYIKGLSRKVSNRLSSEDDKFGIGFSNRRENKIWWLLEFLPVRMSKGSEEYCLTYVSSEPICTAPAGWVYSAEYRDVLQLSDGSRWIKNTKNGSNFRHGDRVIISKLVEDNFLIVNIDRAECRIGYRTTELYLWNECYSVKPYIPEEITKE